MIKALQKTYHAVKSAIQGGINQTFFTVQQVRDLVNFGKREQASISSAMNYGYTNPFFFTIIDDLAKRCANLPTHFVDSEGNKVNSGVQDLKEKPNPHETWHDFYYRVFANLIMGEVFIYSPQIDDSFLFVELFCPNLNDVTVNEGVYGEVMSYTIQSRGKSLTLDKSLVLHIKTPNLACDDNRGFGALRASAYGWDISNNVLSTKQGAFRGVGANKLLTVKGDRPMLPAELTKAQEALDNVSIGKDKVGQSKLIGTELNAIEVGFKPKDYEFGSLQDNDVQFAAMVFKVAPQLYGYSKSSTYNNIGEMKADRLSLVLSTVELVLEELTTWLVQGNYGEVNTFWKVDKSMIPELNKPNLEYMNEAKAIVLGFNQNQYTFAQAFKFLIQLDYSEEEVTEMLSTKPEPNEIEAE